MLCFYTRDREAKRNEVETSDLVSEFSSDDEAVGSKMDTTHFSMA